MKVTLFGWDFAIARAGDISLHPPMFRRIDWLALPSMTSNALKREFRRDPSMTLEEVALGKRKVYSIGRKGVDDLKHALNWEKDHRRA